MENEETFISRWMIIYQEDIKKIFWDAKKSNREPEWQVENLIVPKLIWLANPKNNHTNDRIQLALDFMAIVMDVANLALNDSIAHSALNKLQSWKAEHRIYQACSTVGLLYLGEYPDGRQIEALIETADVMKFVLATLPREIAQPLLAQLEPVFQVSPELKNLVLNAAHVTQTLPFHDEAAICLGSIGVFDDLIYDTLFNIYMKGSLMSTLKNSDKKFIEHTQRVRKAFIYLVQSAPEAGNKFMQFILDRWEHTSTLEITIWMSVYLSRGLDQ